MNNWQARYIILRLIALHLILISTNTIAQRIELLQQGKPTSIRGLSVVNNNVAWVSGSKGYFAVTTDGGKTWNWQQVKGFEKSDFRDIEAFSDKEAVIMSSGTPALILKTVDGGINWKENYRNIDTAYFLDAMDFENPKHGFVMGDPVNNKFLLMESKDGGDTWQAFEGPNALKNQAAFAASGTCLIKGKTLAIATGGSAAEIIIQKANKSDWSHKAVPIIHGKSSQGAFSAASGNTSLIVVGGDYQKDKQQDSTACYSDDEGLTWHSPITFPAGYQSCIEYIQAKTFLSTGTSGTNITTDGGKNYVKIDSASYNVCRKAKHGKLLLLAGDNGKIGIFKL